MQFVGSSTTREIDRMEERGGGGEREKKDFICQMLTWLSSPSGSTTSKMAFHAYSHILYENDYHFLSFTHTHKLLYLGSLTN